MKEIGDILYKLRNRKKMSQEELAEKLNTYRARIHRIEKGIVEPTFREIIEICNIFNVNIDLFYESKFLSSEEFKELSKRYINNNGISFEERRTTIEKMYMDLAYNQIRNTTIDVTNMNKYINNTNNCNKIDIERVIKG